MLWRRRRRVAYGRAELGESARMGGRHLPQREDFRQYLPQQPGRDGQRSGCAVGQTLFDPLEASCDGAHLRKRVGQRRLVGGLVGPVRRVGKPIRQRRKLHRHLPELGAECEADRRPLGVAKRRRILGARNGLAQPLVQDVENLAAERLQLGGNLRLHPGARLLDIRRRRRFRAKSNRKPDGKTDGRADKRRRRASLQHGGQARRRRGR